MLLLPLLSLALVQCSSPDEMPARSADRTLFENDKVLHCKFDEAPEKTYDANGYNRFLYLSEELRQASGLSRITNCEEMKVFGEAFLKYVMDHPEFVNVLNERLAPARRLREESAPPEVPPRKPLDEWKP